MTVTADASKIPRMSTRLTSAGRVVTMTETDTKTAIANIRNPIMIGPIDA